MPARHGCRLPTTMTCPDPLPHPGTKPAPDAVTVALDRAKQVVDFFALSIDDREPLEMAAAEATGGNMTAFEGRVENLRETLDAARAKVQ